MTTSRKNNEDIIEDEDDSRVGSYDQRWGRYGREIGEATESGIDAFTDMMDLGLRMMFSWVDLGMRMMFPMMGMFPGTGGRRYGRGRGWRTRRHAERETHRPS